MGADAGGCKRRSKEGNYSEMTDSVSDGDAARPEADPDTESGDNPAEDVPDSREEADGFAARRTSHRSLIIFWVVL